MDLELEHVDVVLLLLLSFWWLFWAFRLFPCDSPSNFTSIGGLEKSNGRLISPFVNFLFFKKIGIGTPVRRKVSRGLYSLAGRGSQVKYMPVVRLWTAATTTGEHTQYYTHLLQVAQ